MGARKPRLRWRVVSSVVTLVLAAGGPALIAVRTNAGALWWLFLGGGICCLLGAITLQSIQLVRNERAKLASASEADQLRLRTRDALQPIAELIARLPAANYAQRADRIPAIAQAAATGLYMLTSPHAPNVRANVFTLEPASGSMVWLAHVGRGQTPGPFEPGTPRGDAALDFITELKPIRYEDLGESKPDGYEGSMSDYDTFISVPVWSDENVYGMVTVDAPDPGVLSEGDQYLVEVVAELMATAFEVANTEPPPQSPADVGRSAVH